MLTMLLGGLWHGASWTFVIWGALHGFYLAAERFFGIEEVSPTASPLVRFTRGFITFHLVCLAWIFFRANSATQAFTMIKRIAMMTPGESIQLVPLYALVALVAAQLIKTRVDFSEMALARPTASRWLSYACLLLIVVALAGGAPPEFIYFQF
jgi:alginate O-acetyltransferase complex protein AlgI